MRIVIAVLVPLLLLAACGGREAELAAKKVELKDLNAKLEALEAELAAKAEDWQKVEDTFMAASQAMRGAGLSGDPGAREAAKAAYEQQEVAYQKMRSLKSEVLSRKSALKKKKAKVLREILGLGGGDLEPDFE